MNMTTPAEIGIEAGGPEGGDATFKLKDVDRAGDVRRQITRGRMVIEAPRKADEARAEDIASEVEDEEEDALERELDSMYENYQERREDRDTKARAKRVRREAGNGEDDEEFEGFDGEDKGVETDGSSDADLIGEDEDDGFGSEGDGDGSMMTALQPRGQQKKGELSGRAASFFQQDIFKDIGGMGDDVGEGEIEGERDSGVDLGSASPEPNLKPAGDEDGSDEDAIDDSSAASEAENETDQGVGEVQQHHGEDEVQDWDREPPQTSEREGRPNIDIITAEAMTLAHALATGKITKQQLTDDNFNKYSHRDVDGLPEWFLDDEGKHSRPQRPVSAEAAQAIKEKQRALNARPIKKVREAKARKTLRTARRFEKLKKKSDGLAEGGEMSEKDKAAGISALMAKAKRSSSGKKGKKEVKVVKAGGQNKGAGRPRGVKGKYKMVDSRLKKDVRGEKRAAKRRGR